MPEAIAPTPLTAAPLTAAPLADASVAGVGFADQLRATNTWPRPPAASPRETVSLALMVGASATGLTPAGTGQAVAGTTMSVGLGAMGVASPSGVAATRSRTVDQQRTDAVVRFALAQQGKPYVFGTKGPDTFDCSGLTSAAYRQIGIDVPAYTFTQATYGREVDPKTEPLRPGDLIFVRGGRPAQDLGHVGMAISATEWVQAPKTGDVVKVGPLPYDRIQTVRRLVGP